MPVEFYKCALEYRSRSCISGFLLTGVWYFSVTAVAVIFLNAILQLCTSLMNKTIGWKVLNKLKHGLRNAEMEEFWDIAVAMQLSVSTHCFRVYSSVQSYLCLLGRGSVLAKPPKILKQEERK